MAHDPGKALLLTERERDTIAAALRLWTCFMNNGLPDRKALEDIAQGNRRGQHAAMSDEEVMLISH